jgi:hypothetical protein
LEQAVTIKRRTDDWECWDMDRRFLSGGYEEFLPAAEKLYRIYAELLDAEQRHYGIESEEELVSCTVIKIKGIYRTSDEDMYKDIEKRIAERMNDIRKITRKEFDQILEAETANENVSKKKRAMMLAAACYFYTYENKRPHRSFPWLFAEFLASVLKRNQSYERPDTPLQKLTKSIDAIDMTKVRRTFNEHAVAPPSEDGLARIYYILLNWGQKSEFLDGFGDRQKQYESIRIEDFAELLDKVIEEDEEVEDLYYALFFDYNAPWFSSETGFVRTPAYS